MKISSRAQKIPASMTLEITAKVQQLRKEGVSVIGFTAGEPNFNTPEYIINSAKEALDKGLTKYTPVAGVVELRKEIANKLKKDNNLNYDFTQIIVSDGAKSSLYHAMFTIVDEGDDVIIPVPFWFTYEEQVKMCGGKVIPVQTKVENGYKMTAEELENAITDKTTTVVLNSPCNPTGAVYTKDELIALGKVIEKHNLMVISDEIYEKLIYGDIEYVSIATLSDYLYNHTIVINGFSKTYAMTGWRIGYLAAPVEIAKVISKVQGHTTSNACSFAQYACITALKGGEEEIQMMHDSFNYRKELIEKELDKCGLSYIKPQGAFYIFVDVSKFFGKYVDGKLISGSMDFANLLIDHGVAVIPGLPFYADNFIRMSYAIADSDIIEGCKRLNKFVNLIR